MVTGTGSGRMILSGHEFKGEPRWSILSLPFFGRREGTKMLTPFGWFSVLAFAAIAAGAALAFSTP